MEKTKIIIACKSRVYNILFLKITYITIYDGDSKYFYLKSVKKSLQTGIWAKKDWIVWQNLINCWNL